MTLKTNPVRDKNGSDLVYLSYIVETAMPPHPVLLPGKSMGGGAWQTAVHGVAKSWTRLRDLTFTFHFHALEKEMATHSCSCLENPRDGGAWLAAVYGVTRNRTRLKRLSSSSSIYRNLRDYQTEKYLWRTSLMKTLDCNQLQNT